MRQTRVCSVREATLLNSDFLVSPGKTEAAIKNFSPFYSRQYSAAFCDHVRGEVEQQRDVTSQLLKTKVTMASWLADFSHCARLYSS